MNRDFMLASCKHRLKVLGLRYALACQNKNDKGEEITKGAATLIRAQTKRDIQILTLLQQLLLKCTELYIEDQDAIDGFMKLCEPKERHRCKQ